MMRRRILIGLGACVGLLLWTIPVDGQNINTQIQIAINQLVTGITPYTRLRITASDYINWGSGSDASGYGLRDNAGNIEVKNSGGAWTVITGGGGNPVAASYWTRVAESSLTNETVMGSLATGILLNTTTTGVPAIYAGTSCTNQFIRSLDLTGTATCATVSLSTDTSGNLTVSRGGTGLAAGTSGGVLAFTGSTTIASSGSLTNNVLMVGGGAGAAPNTLAAGLGTTTTVLHGNAAGEPTYGAVVLTTDVSGILPGANGGSANGFWAVTGPSASLKTFTFPNASATVLTTNAVVTAVQGGTGLATFAVGDLLSADTTTTLSRVADTSTGNALISGGIGVLPLWGKIGLTTHISGTLAATNGGTGLASYTTGDLLYASSGTTLAARAAVAVGQVLISQGAATAPVWSADVQVATVKLTTVITLSGASPTISSGFGTSPSASGTSAAFRVNVGTGGTADTGIIGMPTAGTGWNCNVINLTAASANRGDIRTIQTGSSTTTVTIQNQTITTGAAAAWAASDSVALSCVAF